MTTQSDNAERDKENPNPPPAHVYYRLQKTL